MAHPPYETILEIENDDLRFTLRSDGAGTLLDKRRHRPWEFWPVCLQERGPVDEGYCWPRSGRSHCDAYPARMRAVREGHGARITMLEEFVGERGSFHVDFSLDGPWLVTEIGDIDESLPSLTYPPPLDADALLLCQMQGRLVRENEQGGRFGHTVKLHSVGTNMPWFGGLLGDAAWITVAEEGAQLSGCIFKGPVAAPIWIRSLGTWNYRRRVRTRFVDDGYVGAAKAYRRFLQDRGEWKTLREKMDERPQLAHLVGGRNVSLKLASPELPWNEEDWWIRRMPADATEGMKVHFTFAQALAVIEECRGLGMRRGQFKIDGWSRGGYDAMHPAIWPPVEQLGPVDQLAAIARQPEPFLCTFHDNYNDTYLRSPDFPAGVCRTREGHPLPGGSWEGGLAYMMNTRDGVRFAQRNLPHYLELRNLGLYCDTLPSGSVESFEPGNTLTRIEDTACRKQILRVFRDAGMIVGGEDGGASVMPELDFYPVGKHTRDGGSAVPLLSLVFHDCAIAYRYVSHAPKPGQTPAEAIRRRALDNVLWGWINGFRVPDFARWPQWRELFSVGSFVDTWHEKIAFDEMTNHRVLDGSGQVERTEWSSGRAVTVNYAPEPWTHGGTTIPALDFHVEE